jgi:HSP20 family protein
MPRIYLERRSMGDDLKRLFDLLDSQARASGEPGECTPPVDVIETAAAVEIIVDLPGVSTDQVHLVVSRGTLLIAGTKRVSACSHSDAAFHLAERAFGRFARAVRIGGAVDAGRARATLEAGELRVVVPRIDERRGREIRIAIETPE